MPKVGLEPTLPLRETELALPIREPEPEIRELVRLAFEGGMACGISLAAKTSADAMTELRAGGIT